MGVGALTLLNSLSGSNNIAIGNQAGFNLTTSESNDIYIGHLGVLGESKTIRIGNTGTQTSCFVAGIFGQTVAGGVPVIVNGNGQLGTVVSSRRFKKDIESMIDQSEKMLKLRPVTFAYKTDPTNAKQYGLIAEEVNEIYPEIIIRDEAGEIYTINYMALIPLLVKQIQDLEHDMKQQKNLHDLEIAQLRQLVNELVARIPLH